MISEATVITKPKKIEHIALRSEIQKNTYFYNFNYSFYRTCNIVQKQKIQMLYCYIIKEVFILKRFFISI